MVGTMRALLNDDKPIHARSTALEGMDRSAMNRIARQAGCMLDTQS